MSWKEKYFSLEIQTTDNNHRGPIGSDVSRVRRAIFKFQIQGHGVKYLISKVFSKMASFEKVIRWIVGRSRWFCKFLERKIF